MSDDQSSNIEILSLNDALGRELALDLVATSDTAINCRALVDGFAISIYNHRIGSWRYKIISEQAATELQKESKCRVLPKGEFTIKVSVGDTLPTDSDCVIPLDKIDLAEGYALPKDGLDLEEFQNTDQPLPICKKGDVLLKKGFTLEAEHITAALKLGLTEASVTC